MEHQKAIEMIKRASVLPFFVLVYLSFPSSELLAGPINGEVFFATFFLIGALALIKAFSDEYCDEHIIIKYTSEVAKSACTGLITGFTFLSLVTLFYWQKNSDLGHLEPLFLMFGLAGTASEGARRLSLNSVKKSANGE